MTENTTIELMDLVESPLLLQTAPALLPLLPLDVSRHRCRETLSSDDCCRRRFSDGGKMSVVILLMMIRLGSE